ncbi:4Fe-4S binding protein [Duganella sp. sic0402]|uniref:4Fe-4S dicluster domain-containing protein n=1 Tax=Duganella sp. sic0402 TaxID=2854786 RepID=UPI001C47DA9F|nr:4Fe-4S dicluster domain-containing protein [Duganella sp. sic0402]MBV7536782.1 4Fe-4S binding protein [Duganella sp. sic0402]
MRRVYVRETSGRHTRRRHCWGWFSQVLFFLLPWLNWDGRQMLLYDVAAVRVALPGVVLGPQQLAWLLLPLLGLVLLLMAASAWQGRLFCGYLCAHTVYADLLLCLERRIEGSRSARMQLDQAPLALRRWRKKFLKHGAWTLLALGCGFGMTAWFTPARALPVQLLHGAPGPWMAVLAYSVFFYVNGMLLRHRVCRWFCPFGPLLGALAGPRTRAVRYHAQRGEPRGLRNAKRDRAVLAAQGDCLDCTLCIQVCPSGSDIRQGERHDCIACGACIDACDQVMRQRGLALGLIAYRKEICSKDGKI